MTNAQKCYLLKHEIIKMFMRMLDHNGYLNEVESGSAVVLPY